MNKVEVGDYVRWTRLSIPGFRPVPTEGIVREVRRKFAVVELNQPGRAPSRIRMDVSLLANMRDVVACPYCGHEHVRREFGFDCPKCGNN